MMHARYQHGSRADHLSYVVGEGAEGFSKLDAEHHEHDASGDSKQVDIEQNGADINVMILADKGLAMCPNQDRLHAHVGKRVDHPFIAQDEADKWDDQVTAIRVDACRPLNRGEVKRLCQDFRQDYLPNLEHDSADNCE